MNEFTSYTIQMKKKAEKSLDGISEPYYSKIIFAIDDLTTQIDKQSDIKKLWDILDYIA